MEAFIRLPWSIYHGNRTWVPPLIRDVRAMMDPERHPFHRHSEVQAFLALRDGRPVGRVAAIHNRRHIEFHQENVGFFGFYECERDAAASARLLDAAAGWLRERGLATMRGPTSFSTNEEAGLLVEGFDDPPAVMMAYNPPYYEEQFEAYGLSPSKTLLAYHVFASRPPEYLVRAAAIVERRTGVKVRPLRMRDFDRELEIVRDIYNAAWRRNWGFVPMTDEEIRHMARELKPVVDPRLALIGEDAGGRPVGFALALPDFNQVLRRLNGRLFPFGVLKALWLRRRIDSLRVLTLGVLEEYRGKGLDALFYLGIFRGGNGQGINQGEFSWVLEDNVLMRRPLERMGARVHKRYRIYDVSLGASRSGAMRVLDPAG
jgi:GNAT superfamily N-acetyltransferase